MKHKAVHLPNLTPLRGLAALLIVVLHFNGIVLHLSFSTTSMFLSKCYLMVDLFFIISGFIILHVYGENFNERITASSYLGFLKARFARIYPLHLFSLLILIPIVYLSLNPYSTGPLEKLINNPKAIITHLLLLQSFGIHPIFTWNVPSWSISAEWWVYMLFPILAFSLARKKSLTIIGSVGFVLVLYLLLVYYLPRPNSPWDLPNNKDINVSYEFGYIRGLAGFITGMLTYLLYKKKSLIRYLSRDGVGVVCIITLILTMNVGINDLFYIPQFMLLVLCVVANKNIIHKISMWRPLQFLGEISYSIYMIHYLLILNLAVPMLSIIGFDYKGPGSIHPPLFQGLAICAIFLLIVILISSITFEYVEKPWRMRLNKK